MKIQLSEKKVKQSVIIVSLISLFIFYLNQNLYFVNTLNDFNEYVMRAESWLHGDWAAWGGTDKLLSIIELIALKFYPNDFLSFIKWTKNIIIVLLFVNSIVFIFIKNEFLPSREIRFFIVLFLLTMPYFVFKTVTIDQSLLFASMLLLFFSTYFIPYLGFISLIVYISRPEAIMLFGLYPILFFLDKKNRKNIIINFITFIVLFISLKIWEHFYIPQIGAGGQQEFQVLTHNIEKTSYTRIFLISFEKIPILFFDFFKISLQILQSYLLWFIFIIGAVFSIKEKRYYPFYLLGIFYFFMSQFRSFNNIDYSRYFSDVVWLFNHSSFLPQNIFIGNGYKPQFDMVIGHSRYHLPIYLYVATFVILGFKKLSFWIAKYATPLFTKKKITEVKLKHKKKIITKQKIEKIEIFSRKKMSYIILSLFMFFAIAYNVNIYNHFKIPYKFNVQWAKTNAVYKLATEIRKNHNINDKIFIEAYCESSDGQFPTMVTSYSGVYNVMLRLCDKASMRVSKNPEGKKRISYEEIKDKGTFGFVIVHSTNIDYKRSFAPTIVNNFKNLYKPEALDSIGIRYIISQRNLKEKFPQLELKKTEGNLFLFEHHFAKDE